MVAQMGRVFRLGTDGWRGVIADDFTFENVRTVTAAVAEGIRCQPGYERGVVVGYDRRLLADEFAQAAAEILAGDDLKAHRASRPGPTPALSHFVSRNESPSGIMVTASRNPPQFDGLKVKSSYGGSAEVEVTAQIEQRANQLLGEDGDLVRVPLGHAEGKGLVRGFEPAEGYLDHLLSFVDCEAIGRARRRLVVDAVHGAAADFLHEVLREAGCEVEASRAEVNPAFGGRAPEPIDENLGGLLVSLQIERVHSTDAVLGLATDGDGDRIAAATEERACLNSPEVFALLLVHLVQDRGLRGGIAKTVSTSSVIDRLGERYGLPVHETPIGFRYICRLMRTDNILIGAEESGGTGVRGHMPERDALLASLLLVEMLAQRGTTPGRLLAELRAEVGEHYYRRADLPVERGEAGAARPDIERHLLSHINSLPILDGNRRDGVKLILPDGAWLLLRPSNAEPVVRICAEGRTLATLSDLIREGEALVRSSLADTTRGEVSAYAQR
jgi:phosphomannomutase